jgi:hypothetical protein
VEGGVVCTSPCKCGEEGGSDSEDEDLFKLRKNDHKVSNGH